VGGKRGPWRWDPFLRSQPGPTSQDRRGLGRSARRNSVSTALLDNAAQVLDLIATNRKRRRKKSQPIGVSSHFLTVNWYFLFPATCKGVFPQPAQPMEEKERRRYGTASTPVHLRRGLSAAEKNGKVRFHTHTHTHHIVHEMVLMERQRLKRDAETQPRPPFQELIIRTAVMRQRTEAWELCSRSRGDGISTHGRIKVWAICMVLVPFEISRLDSPPSTTSTWQTEFRI
jgi:hypothetical protein